MCFKSIIRVTYDPASFISGHVTVDLHTLAGVSVDVNGVDAAERLSIQQVLSAILGSGKKTTSWKDYEKHENQGYFFVVAVCFLHYGCITKTFDFSDHPQ